MADDIVTQLRELMADLLYNPDCDDEGCGDCAWHRIGADAIDEIERLRAALAIASGMISTMPQYKREHPESIMGMLVEETRRG